METYGFGMRMLATWFRESCVGLELMNLRLIKVYMLDDCSASQQVVAWPNGKALDYESRDSRFDPWRDHFVLLYECLKWCS